jgi:hypothetical protein
MQNLKIAEAAHRAQRAVHRCLRPKACAAIDAARDHFRVDALDCHGRGALTIPEMT